MRTIDFLKYKMDGKTGFFYCYQSSMIFMKPFAVVLFLKFQQVNNYSTPYISIVEIYSVRLCRLVSIFVEIDCHL